MLRIRNESSSLAAQASRGPEWPSGRQLRWSPTTSSDSERKTVGVRLTLPGTAAPIYLEGESWSPQVWSMMERSVGGQRVRAFAADELVGLALGLKAPLVALFLPPHPEAKRLSRICADDGKKGTSTLGLLKLVTEIDEATRSRIRKLAGPITDQVGGPDWRELEITSVEQERKAQIDQEMKGLVSRLTELVRTPAWFDDRGSH